MKIKGEYDFDHCNLSTLLLEEQSFLVNLGLNYQFDVLLRVLLFQVKKQEIYREVN